MPTTAAPRHFLLTGGQLVDGTGTESRAADVEVNDGRIAAIREPGSPAGSQHRIDISGLTVSPGFIDLHTHCDFTLPEFPRADAMVRQGVTTMLVGNCGHSVFPVGHGERADLIKRYSAFLNKNLEFAWSTADEYMQILEGLPLAVNVALQVGHGTVRIATMGFEARPPTPAELTAMEADVDAAMRAGAFGFSSGLIYAPGTYAQTDELVTLARVASAHGGFYSTHMRNEGASLLDAMAEAITIAESAGVPLELSHHKVLGRENWGLTKASLNLIDETRGRGVDVSADQYPYEASSTTLTALLPTWALDGGVEAMRHRLANGDERQRLRHEILHGPPDGRSYRAFEPETVIIASAPDRTLIGSSLGDIGELSGREPVDVMLDVLRDYGGGVEVVIFAIGDDDIRRVMCHPQVAVASDGWTLHPSAGGTPHPRSYGTFARVLGHYVREEKVLTLPEAVRKMTSLPAQRLGVSDLGVVRRGARADLVVFDPERIRDRATFTAPHQFCEGVTHVFVNGVPVIVEGEDQELPAGTMLRGPGYGG